MSYLHSLRRPGRSGRFARAGALVFCSAFLAALLLGAFFRPRHLPQAAEIPPGQPSRPAEPTAPGPAASPQAGATAAPGTLGDAAVSPTAGPVRDGATGLAPRPTGTSSPTATAAQSPSGPTMAPTQVAAQTPTLPAATPTATPQPTPLLPYFGVALQQVDAAHGLALAAAAGAGVTRISELNWDYVEPVRTEPPTYLWDKMSGLEQELVNAAQAGIRVTLLVMYTPLWARQVPGRACSPIREDALDEYAQFVQAAVARYSQPPFGIRDWEFYNEPDVDPSLVAAYSGIGCWGDAADPFYGGRAFGRMLLAAYPAVKKADPAARVIVGGLLLDSPTSPPAAFTAGILEAGAGNSFDLLAFHAYTYYSTSGNPELDRRADMPWSSRGGVVEGKAAFLREVMARYGVSKPLILNEAGMGWFGSKPPPAEFPLAQAEYVTRLYTRGRALDLVSVIWYGWEAPGWRHMALLNADLSPRPGAAALAVAVEQLDGASYIGPAGYEGLEGYVFRRDSEETQVVWPAGTQAQTIRLPLSDLRRAMDALGNPVPHGEESGQAVLTVERPLYLVMAP